MSATASATNTGIRTHHLAYSYPKQRESVFRDLNIEVRPSSLLAVLGNNGAGKSTLLDLAAGLAQPKEGHVEVAGNNLATMGRREAAQHIAYVTQRQTIPHLTVYDEVLLGRKPHITWQITDNDRAVVARAIERLDLEPFAGRYCDELSGGERQKVSIARALAQEPEVLILDEPTSALDPKNQIEVMQAIQEVTLRDNLATILVLHDLNLALRFCNQFVLMRNGRIVAQGDKSIISEPALSKTYDTQFKLIEVDGTTVAVPSLEGPAQ